MSERPRVLDDLGVELDRVGRRNLAASGELRLAPRRLSAATVLIAGLLLLGAAAAAAALLINQGAPLPAPHAQDLRSSGIPIPGSARLAGLDAPDPDPEAPPWDIRLSRTRAGETCTAVGQVVDGKFGIVGLDHTFRALPLGGVDACGVASPDGPMLAGARVFVGSSPQEARTIVNGVAGEGARSVTAFGPEGSRVLRLGPSGSFITVYRGYVEEVRPESWSWEATGAVTRSPSRSHRPSKSQIREADPRGKSAAEKTGNRGPSRMRTARRLPRRLAAPTQPQRSATDSAGVRTPGAAAAVRADAPVRPGSGDHTGYPWGNNPTRTLVYGAVAPRVRSLTLTVAGTATSRSTLTAASSWPCSTDTSIHTRSPSPRAYTTGRRSHRATRARRPPRSHAHDRPPSPRTTGPRLPQPACAQADRTTATGHPDP